MKKTTILFALFLRIAFTLSTTLLLVFGNSSVYGQKKFELAGGGQFGRHIQSACIGPRIFCRTHVK